MSKQFAPILDRTPASAERKWDNEVLDVLDQYTGDDEYTYTMRVSVPEEERAALRDKLPADLVALLDEHGWDVSFLVDGW